MTFRTLNEAERATWASADKSNAVLRFNRTQQDAGWSDRLDGYEEPREPSPIAVIVGALLIGAPVLGVFLYLALSGAGFGQ